MSGSLKDLTKAINTATASATLILPLPDDLFQVITAYLEKHAVHDESDEKRLQDELLSIYQASIVEHPSRLAPFLKILRLLRLSLRAPGRLLQWWDKLSPPIMVHLGVEKGLAIEVKNILLSILVYDEDEEEPAKQSAKATSDAVVENLISIWLVKTKIAAEEFDDHAKFVENQISLILLAFGKKRPKDFLTAIDKFFVKKDSRIRSLSLLCQFFRHQPPHLHQLLQTPLFHNLLRCLQIDTSTRSISLAMTALIMFLPHIPITASQHLPALFNIYSRLLFWDRERRAVEPRVGTDDDEKSVNNNETPWEKLPYLLESEDENVPELLHYFTFLYGLYPINFMSYIRKPQKYLRHANFAGADDIDIEPSEIRQRSEPFRQVHLLHTNFFHLTLESELTDNNRWRRSEAADVVTECMALYVPSEDGHEHAARARGPPKKVETNSDIPDQPLLERDFVTPYQSRHTSWRNTTSTAVASASPEGYRQTALHRKLSQTSQSMPSIADSPSIRPSDHLESPTIAPQMLGPHHTNQLSDMLNAQKSTRGSLYQSLTNDSVASLALSNVMHDPSHVDAYLASLSRDDIPRSPSLRPTTTITTESIKVAYLNREIQLLNNDLNFERYLKQQHLSHIGQLRRKQIREARVEAETQNLINSNRGLKVKLEEAKRVYAQIKKETEKSKTHSRKWESDLTAKLRALREEQKKWIIERERLSKDLENAVGDAKSLRQIVVTSERNELAAKQKMASVESSLDELDRLRAAVEKLTARIRSYEAWERDAAKAKASEEEALSRVELLQMELKARDEELLKTKQAFEEESYAVRPIDEDKDKRKAALSREVIESALAGSRARIIDLKKAHNQLLSRYNTLQAAYMDVREQLQVQATERPLIGGSPGRSGSNSPIPRAFPRRKHSSSDPERFDYMSSPPTGPLPAIPRPKVDTSHRTSTPMSGRSPTSGSVQPQFFQAPQPFSPPGPAPSSPVPSSTSIGGSSGSGDHDPPAVSSKAKPQSDARIYGRGKSSSYYRI